MPLESMCVLLISIVVPGSDHHHHHHHHNHPPSPDHLEHLLPRPEDLEAGVAVEGAVFYPHQPGAALYQGEAAAGSDAGALGAIIIIIIINNIVTIIIIIHLDVQAAQMLAQGDLLSCGVSHLGGPIEGKLPGYSVLS